MTTTYTPREGSLPSRLIDFFIRQPDEELSIKDIALKFDCAENSVRSTLTLAVRNGALVLAINGKHASLGWLGFLGSNIALIVFAARAGLYGVLTLQLGFMVTSLIGVWQGLLKPLLRNANLSPPATKEKP